MCLFSFETHQCRMRERKKKKTSFQLKLPLDPSGKASKTQLATERTVSVAIRGTETTAGREYSTFTASIRQIESTLIWAEKGASVCVWRCQRDQDQATQSDLKEPGLINAALRPAGLETQRCFCCPVARSVFPPPPPERPKPGVGKEREV